MRETLARILRAGHAVPGEPLGPRRILIVGDRGREHALAWRFVHDRPDATLYRLPHTDGMTSVATELPIDRDDIDGIADWSAQERPDLDVVGPCGSLEPRANSIGATSPLGHDGCGPGRSME